MENMARDYASSSVGSSKLVKGLNYVAGGGQRIGDKDRNNTEAGPVLSRVVSMSTGHAGWEVSALVTPSIGERDRPAYGFHNRVPHRCVRDSPSRITVKRGSIEVVFITALLTGWSEAEPEWVKTGANTT